MTWFGSPQRVFGTDGLGCGCCSRVISQRTDVVGRCTQSKVSVKVIPRRNKGGALPLCVVFPRRSNSQQIGGILVDFGPLTRENRDEGPDCYFTFSVMLKRFTAGNLPTVSSHKTFLISPQTLMLSDECTVPELFNSSKVITSGNSHNVNKTLVSKKKIQF